MRIALVHDYFVQDGGAERVALAFHKLFPEAPVFCLLATSKHLPPGMRASILRPSTLNNALVHPKLFSALTPLMPLATEHIDLANFDTVLISSSSFGKGVITPPHVKTLCYLHTPTRFLWEERFRYAKERGWPKLLRAPLHAALHRLRAWDERAAQRSDVLLTNSTISQARIARYYHRSADILHPPIDLANIPFAPQASRDYWLTGGRLVAYKRFDLSIRVANHLRAPLKIFGSGPEEARLRSMAGPTVEVLGSIPEAQKYALFAGARGFLHPHVEDFGMTMLESLASGTPVLGYGVGGAAEILRPPHNGLFLSTPTPSALMRSMRQAEATTFDPTALRKSVEAFDLPLFQAKILTYVHNTH